MDFEKKKKKFSRATSNDKPTIRSASCAVAHIARPSPDLYQTFAMPDSSDNGSSSNGGNRNSPHDDSAAPRDAHPDNTSVPKPKRLACMICRKRKLKCDGIRPSCSTCSRLGHNCAYDEQRRKSGPKRGYVKALEERLSENPSLPPSPASIPLVRKFLILLLFFFCRHPVRFKILYKHGEMWGMDTMMAVMTMMAMKTTVILAVAAAAAS